MYGVSLLQLGMRALISIPFLCLSLIGCSFNPTATNRFETVTPAQPQLQASAPLVYSRDELMAILVAQEKYVRIHQKALSSYRPVVVFGKELPAGVRLGQSYRPGTAMLRQLGFLSFDAPGVDVWVDVPQVGCSPGRCAILTHVRFNDLLLTKPGDY